MAEERPALAFRFPLRIAPAWRRHPAPWLIGLALVLNVAAVLLPFLDMRRGLSSDTYSLPRSVEMLWDAKLYVLALVVVLFSIVFPFVKLAILGAIVLGRIAEPRAGRLLAFVERFGKWSMLDVFLVCLMLALANDQLLVDAAPREGILCFTSAIVISMWTSGRMQVRLGSADAGPAPPNEVPRPILLWHWVLLGLLLAALLVPFLEIDDWLLDDHPVSIAISIAGLWQTGAQELAVVIALFLVVAPVASGSFALLALYRLRRGRDASGLLRRLALLRHWEMLDVFALALGIFLVEGGSFVKTNLSWGAFLLALLLVSYWAVAALQARRMVR